MLGVGAYADSGAASVTALIPAFIGVPILISARLSVRSSHPPRWDRVAALFGLLGLLGSVGGLRRLPELLPGADLARPMAVAIQSAMALLCLSSCSPWWPAFRRRGIHSGDRVKTSLRMAPVAAAV